jgi:UTP--glucose-1-phosphate uridylyltransferase
MQNAGLSQAAMDAFKHNYEQLVGGASGLVPEADINPVTELPHLASLHSSHPPQGGSGSDAGDTSQLLQKTAMLKLNGGLGTSMGLEKAKSLLKVKADKTFLDLIAEQVKYMRTSYGSNVRFILMDSFSTSKDTRDFLQHAHPDLLQEPDIELMQNSSCKVDAATLKPAHYPANPSMEWAPPGHGDIYPSLVGSGMLERLLDEGVTYLFVSNSDNLGATLDLDILRYFASSNKSFLMEVCERTAGDKKGGHLAQRKSDGRLMLRESAMCPDEDKTFFEDISRHKFFNTNNLWLNLSKLKDTLEKSGGILRLPLIKNKKTVNPRDKKSAPVFQLETAMGSAIECFDDAGAIVVPRSRFAPVKTCSDLFALRSDAYRVTEKSTVELAAASPPLVKLDDAHYKLVDDMEALTPRIPSLVGCRSLTVRGAIRFEGGVFIQGDVTLINDGEEVVAARSRTFADTTVNVREVM